MSRVFLAEETALKRKVVVKILPPDLFVGVNVERFNREILLAAKLQHPHIVPVLTAGETNGVPYYTMPFVEGESLRVRLARGPLSVSETIGLLRDVAKALAYAHEHGVVHRDIKPDNVLVTGGSAAVTDFGIAKAISVSRTSEGQGALTQVGTSIGTPAYMAPEQSAADPHTDQRADIYSFGCMAYELLAGRPPFAGRTAQGLLAAHMGEVPESIATIRPDTPAGLANLISRCLEKDANQRPQSAVELVLTLETIASTGSGALTPHMPVGPGTFSRAVAIYAASFIAVAILAKAAMVAIGLPDWVFPGSVLVMALGFPVVLWTGYVQRVARRAMTTSPTVTPGGTLAVTHGGLQSIALKAAPHVSWYRTARGGVYALGAFAVAIAVFMTLRSLGIGPFGSLIAAGRLREREPLLLASFRVVNGDSSLGSLVGEAVRTSLEQSEVVKFATQATINAGLANMRRGRDTPLDDSIARDLAVRKGIRAILDGEIRVVQGKFFLTVHIISADSGLVLATARAHADDAQQLVFKAADEVAAQIRGRVGESLRSVQRAAPLSQATTSSTAALRKYTRAVRLTLIQRDTEALRLAQEAAALDSDFAAAYIRIAINLQNLNIRAADADSAIAHAYRLRDRLPETQRDGLIANYFGSGPGRDRGRGIEAWQRILDRGEYGGTNSIGLRLASRREFARAESRARIRMKVEPDAIITYDNAVHWQLEQGKIAAAESTLRYIDTIPSDGNLPGLRARLAYARDSIGRATAILDSAQRRQSHLRRVRDLASLAELSVLQGRLGEARQRRRERFMEDSTRGADLTPADDSLHDIRLDAWLFGPSPRAIDRINRLVSSPAFAQAAVSVRPYLDVASTYAFVGRADSARAMLGRYGREVVDTTRKRWEKPDYDAALGEIALAEHRPKEAVAAFRAADMRPDGPATSCTVCLFARLARVYDAADESTIPRARDSTIAMLERYFASPRLIEDDYFDRAVFSKRLAELYEAKGDKARAASYYTKFIALWKDADPALQPKVAEAKKRLLTLEDQERVPKRAPN